MSTGQKTSSGKNRTPTGRTVANTASKPDGLLSHYPLSSVLVVFGLGLAAGVALGSIIGGPFTPRPSFGQRAGLAAEHFGRQTLGAIAGVLPE
jgi:hypothetical protein